MLAALPFVPDVLNGWISAWSYGSSMDSTANQGTGRAVGLADVRRIEEMRQRFAQIDYVYGGGLVRPAVVDYLNTTVAPLLRGTYNDQVGAALLTAAAEMTLFAGWTAFDIERHGQAQHYYGQALKLAKAADNPLAGARVLSTMAHQAIHLNKPEQAILLARAAVEAGRRGQASHQAMALLLVREARATALKTKPAKSGDRHAAKQIARLLVEAERAHAQGARDGDPQWVHGFDEPELAAQAGIILHLVGDHDRAAERLEHSVQAFATYRPRSSHLNRVNAAEAYLSRGELEQALDHARAATNGAKTLTSPRLLEHIKRFDKRLKPYEKTIQVREFRAYLDHAMAV
jgi:tetratricopeptide (TPR) repeat protein